MNAVLKPVQRHRIQALHADMGRRVIELLSSITGRKLPANGLIAGQSVCSALFELYRDDMKLGVFNDIDIFTHGFSAWGRGQGQEIFIPTKHNGPDEVAMGNYGPVLFVSGESVYRVSRSFRDGLLNIVEIRSTRHMGAGNGARLLDPRVVLSGFDFNLVQVGVDITSKKLLWTPYFAWFWKSLEMIVVGANTPAASSFRWFHKRAAMPQLRANDEVAMSALSGFALGHAGRIRSQMLGPLYAAKAMSVEDRLAPWWKIKSCSPMIAHDSTENKTLAVMDKNGYRVMTLRNDSQKSGDNRRLQALIEIIRDESQRSARSSRNGFAPKQVAAIDDSLLDQEWIGSFLSSRYIGCRSISHLLLPSLNKAPVLSFLSRMEAIYRQHAMYSSSLVSASRSSFLNAAGAPSCTAWTTAERNRSTQDANLLREAWSHEEFAFIADAMAFDEEEVLRVAGAINGIGHNGIWAILYPYAIRDGLVGRRDDGSAFVDTEGLCDLLYQKVVASQAKRIKQPLWRGWLRVNDVNGVAYQVAEMTKGSTLIREGILMHHCVGGYAEVIKPRLNSEDRLFRIRKAGSWHRSERLTLQLSRIKGKPFGIQQLSGLANRSAHTTEKALCLDIMRHANEKIRWTLLVERVTDLRKALARALRRWRTERFLSAQKRSYLAKVITNEADRCLELNDEDIPF